MCKFVSNAWHVLLAFSKFVFITQFCLIFFLAHKLYCALGAVTMLLLVFKFIVGLYIACFNGSRFVAVTFFSAECRDMRCFYVL